MQPKAGIITIGDELLIGQVIDTNSAWIAQQLNQIGIDVIKRVAVGDNYEAIWQTIESLEKEVAIIIITGGLGPTADDITKPLLCHYFGGKMVIDKATEAHLEHIFKEVLKRPMIERNRKQAEVPDVCTVLLNKVGTAPGMQFQKEECLYFSLPGVPHEMKWIMQNSILPMLKNKYGNYVVLHETLLTAGIGESFLAERLQTFEANLPSNIQLAYLPNYGMVRLRLTAKGLDSNQLKESLCEQFELLKKQVNTHLVTDKDQPLEEVVGDLLLENKATVSTAESCTGGYIAHLLSSRPGASAYFWGSIVSYHNDVKQHNLGVDATILSTNGAVSEETVTAMAQNVRKQMGTNYSIAVSGILGPGGGTPDKPVGTVWIAAAGEQKTVAKKFNFHFDRERNKQLTTINALNLLRMLIVDNS
ncbi:MAG: competence/damage-inducible protein A [Chitinophagaceae bacterium]